MYHSKVLATSFSTFKISVSKKQMTSQKIWNILKSYHAPSGNPSRSEDMSVILWIFKISAAGYNFLRRSRRDIWGEFHVLFGQYTGKRSFYYWLPQCDCSLPDKMTTIADWTKKSSLMRVWCQVTSKMTVYPYNQTFKKKTVFVFCGCAMAYPVQRFAPSRWTGFPSFLLKTHPARHTIQYFFLSAVILSEKKTIAKTCF